MYLHIIHNTGETVCIDISGNSSWRQTKHLKYWRKQKHVKEAYLSHDETPNTSRQK